MARALNRCCVRFAWHDAGRMLALKRTRAAPPSLTHRVLLFPHSYRRTLGAQAAMMAVMHALFWLGTIIIIHDRFVWAHLGLLLLTALFTLGGYPVWAQRSATQRLHFRTTHTLLQLFFVLLLGYVLVQAVVCVATCAAARLIINRYCKDQSRLCRPGAVSHDWLRFGFIAGVISLSSSFVALAFYMARYVFVYIVFLEWAHRRHAAPGSVELALWGPVRKIGGMLVRAGISLKKCLCFCCQLEDDHDSEVDEAVPDHHYATHVASRKSEQRRADAAAVDEEAAEQSGSEQDEGWLNLFTSSHTSSDDLVTYACLCCCCICCLGSLVGCIVVNGVLGDIFCLIFEIIVRSA